MAWSNMAKTLEMLASLGDGWQTKSYGKKGKGKGKGKHDDKPEAKRWCHWDDCTAAQGKKPTCGKSSGCYSCKRLWAKAPPIERLVDWAFQDKLKSQEQPTAKGKGKGKGKGKTPAAAPAAKAEEATTAQLAKLRQERLAGLKKEEPAAKEDKDTARLIGGTPPQKDEPRKEEEATPKKEPWLPRSLECEVIDSMNTFQESFHTVVDSIALDLFPNEELPIGVETIVKDLLADCKVAESTLEFDNLQKEVDALKQQLALGIPGSAAEKTLQEILAQREAALAKADRKKPSKAVQSQGLTTLLSDWELSMKQGDQRGQVGAERAKQRREDRWETLGRLEEHMALIKKAFQYHDSCLEESHAERTALLTQRDQKVVERLSQEIAVAKEAEGKQMAAVAAQAGPAADAQLADLLGELAKSRAAQQELLAKVQLLQIASGSAAASADQATPKTADPKGQEPMAILSADDIFDEADPKDLPDLSAITKAQLESSGHLFQLLLLWTQGGCQPVTFGELKTYSTAGHDAPSLLWFLLGQKLWDGWFDLLADPVPDFEVIPRQAMTFAAIALDRIKAKYDAVETTRAAAAKAFAKMTECQRHKKRKTAAT